MERIKLDIPNDVQMILNRLNTSITSGYIVGGCVRDACMGREPNDWDFCTSCSPETIKQLFSDFNTIDTGIKHGTVTVVLNNIPYEITTYRIDGEYDDNRHPSSVIFTDKLEDDLSRRDFTINAMAYNHIRGLIDPFGGMDDIYCGVIRCVGNPDDRFIEDALRIMRAERFAMTLNFNIEFETHESMMENKYLLKNISVERIRSEFNKAISNDTYMNPRMMKFLQVILPEYLSNAAVNEINFTLGKIKTSGLITWAFIHQIIYEHKCRSFIDDPKGLMKKMKFSNYEINEVFAMLTWLNKKLMLVDSLVKNQTRIDPLVEMKYMLRDHDKATVENILKFVGLYSKHLGIKSGLISDCAIAFESVMSKAEKECHTLSMLAINGNDVMEYNFQGKDVGAILNYILDKVIKGELENDRGVLRNYIKNEC